MKGLWIDVMFYEGEDPESEVDCDVCNGTVYTEEEVQLIKAELERMSQEYLGPGKSTVRGFLGEVSAKLDCGLECL